MVFVNKESNKIVTIWGKQKSPTTPGVGCRYFSEPESVESKFILENQDKTIKLLAFCKALIISTRLQKIVDVENR